MVDGDKQVSNNRYKGLRPRWKPGESGNPKGRPPKDACLTSLIKELLDKDAGYIGTGSMPDDKTWRQVVIKALLTKAGSGDVKAIDLILDRVEGKVKQDIGLEGDVPVNIIYKLKETDATK